jgi:hypothetical protein
MIITEQRENATYYTDENVEFSVVPADHLMTFKYWMLMVPPEEPVGKVLVLGVCANTTGTLMTDKYGPLDCVLVDQIEQEGFPLTVTSDAWTYLEGCTDSVDWVLVDVYNRCYVPDFVYTLEFSQKLAFHCDNVMINLPTYEANKFDLSSWNLIKTTALDANDIMQLAKK